MKHEKWQELAALDAGNDLSPRQAERFRRHAETCPECRELARALREQGRQLASLAAETTDEPTFAEIRRTVLAAVAAEEPLPRTTLPFPARPIRRKWALAAGLALLPLLAWFALRQAPAPAGHSAPGTPRSARAAAPPPTPEAAAPAASPDGAWQARPFPPAERTARDIRPPRPPEPTRAGRAADRRHQPESRDGFALADIHLQEIEIRTIEPPAILPPDGQRAPIRLVADRPGMQIIWFNDNHGGMR